MGRHGWSVPGKTRLPSWVPRAAFLKEVTVLLEVATQSGCSSSSSSESGNTLRKRSPILTVRTTMQGWC